VHHQDGRVTFRTEDFTLEPGQEKFLCYTQTLDRDVVVGGYSINAKPYVHHTVLSKTAGDEPEGMSECDVLFRLAWEPIFPVGAGEYEIQFPEGIGQVLPAGTRLLAQLHLLNAGKETVVDSAELDLHLSPHESPRELATFAFGNFNVNLPPLQSSKIESVCSVKEQVEVVAAFPHMHQLATSLTFEVGPSADRLSKVFERNPYDFDNQNLELVNLTLNAGDVTRVTCNYDNTTDKTITFGESTFNEMCFFVGFAADRSVASGCIVGTPTGLSD
jgi:hypothetical protein